MKLIIDIPDEDYKFIKLLHEGFTDFQTTLKLYREVKNGIPIPKGHGRLIILSENALKRQQTSLSASCQNWISEVGLSNAIVAIIEANKEEDAI